MALSPILLFFSVFVSVGGGGGRGKGDVLPANGGCYSFVERFVYRFGGPQLVRKEVGLFLRGRTVWTELLVQERCTHRLEILLESFKGLNTLGELYFVQIYKFLV